MPHEPVGSEITNAYVVPAVSVGAGAIRSDANVATPGVNGANEDAAYVSDARTVALGTPPAASRTSRTSAPASQAMGRSTWRSLPLTPAVKVCASTCAEGP